MTKVLFTETGIKAGTVHEVFEKGTVHDLPNDQVQRWLSRGKITTDADAVAAVAGSSLPADVEESKEPCIVPRDGGGFDVLNSAGVAVNDRPLKRKVAEETLAALLANPAA